MKGTDQIQGGQSKPQLSTELSTELDSKLSNPSHAVKELEALFRQAVLQPEISAKVHAMQVPAALPARKCNHRR
jgi:hypothetical protein